MKQIWVNIWHAFYLDIKCESYSRHEFLLSAWLRSTSFLQPGWSGRPAMEWSFIRKWEKKHTNHCLLREMIPLHLDCALEWVTRQTESLNNMLTWRSLLLRKVWQLKRSHWGHWYSFQTAEFPSRLLYAWINLQIILPGTQAPSSQSQ